MIDNAGGFNNVINTFLSWIPQIVQTLVVLLIGYLIAILIKRIVESALHRTHLNERVEERSRGWFGKISDNPVKFIGKIVYWLIWIFVITIAIPILNIPFLNQLVYDFYAYIPNIISSILILVISIALAAGASSLVSKILGDTPTGRITMTVLPVLIMTIAVFMILVQLKIAIPIVIITYASLVGAMALGFALAFGLGGQGVASKILDEAYKKGQEHVDQVRRDMRLARERGEKEIDKVKE